MQRGFTLVELMVTVALGVFLALLAAPALSDYVQNARLRAAGDELYMEVMYAQSEAIKRNGTIGVNLAGRSVTVSDLRNPANPEVLRQHDLNPSVNLAAVEIKFTSAGWPLDMLPVSVNVVSSTLACSADHRCPGLRVDGGGAVRLCADHLASC